MKPKNAIIILIIVTVVAATAVYFIYRNLQSGKNKIAPLTQPIVKELTPEERRLEAIKLMDEVEKNNPTITTDPKELEKKRQAAIKLMDEVEKNSNNK
jgi:hypothetical protein